MYQNSEFLKHGFRLQEVTVMVCNNMGYRNERGLRCQRKPRMIKDERVPRRIKTGSVHCLRGPSARNPWFTLGQ